MKDRGVVETCERHFHKYKSNVNVTEEVKQNERSN